MADEQVHDPLNFMRSMWGNMGFSLPGMITPTLDVDELEKRIKDMKAVEGWLRMNLSMLQMTIQGLEMQHTTLSAVQRMGDMVGEARKQATRETPSAKEAPSAESSPEAHGAEAALWPWQMMQQMREQLQQSAEAVVKEMTPEAAPAKSTPRRKKTS